MDSDNSLHFRGLSYATPAMGENGDLKEICDCCGSGGSVGEPAGNGASRMPCFLCFLCLSGFDVSCVLGP